MAKILIVVQLEDVHLRPILKVLRGIIKTMRLVIQNRMALKPAGPKGKIAQNKEETLARDTVSGRLCAGTFTHYTSLQRQQRQRDAKAEQRPQHEASEYAILK